MSEPVRTAPSPHPVTPSPSRGGLDSARPERALKILVTGATGFLGAHLVPKLVALGHRVRGLGRTPPPKAFADLKVEFVQGDLKDRAVVKKALEGVDVIYHLAGRVSFHNEDGRLMHDLHVQCTRGLLEEVVASGVKPRIILASTSGTCAVSKEERVGTEADEAPLAIVGHWPYYLSKIYEERLAVQLCQRHGIPLVVLNPSLLMGPGDDRLSSTWTVTKFLQGDIPVMPNGGISFVDPRDVADAAVAALTKGELYGRHLMGVNLTNREFLKRLEHLSGVAAPRLTLPSKASVFGAEVLKRYAKWRGTEVSIDPQEVEVGEHYFWVDSSKAERLLGFKARDPWETLHDTVAACVAKMPPGHRPERWNAAEP